MTKGTYVLIIKMMLKLHLLSAPKLEIDGQTENIRLNAPTSLLVYLAYRKKWIPRGELAFLYKPDELENDAKRYLRLLIHRAKSIPWAAKLEVERSQLRFLIDTDVADFLEADKEENWTLASTLYKGSFLNGLSLNEVYSFNGWLELERTELEYKYQNSLKQSAEELTKQADNKLASKQLLKLLDYDWTNEEVVRLAMRSAYASGQADLAKKIYKKFAEVLKDELDLEPLLETKNLFEKLGSLNGLEPIQSIKTSFTKLSLPAQSTRFIGRKNDLSKLNQYCSSAGCRMLSVVGLGGIGKTRLGLELARSQVSNFPDGIFFIALADIKTNMLASVIARALDLNISDDTKTKEILFNNLKDKKVLLILDNFEHILEAKMLVSELLESASRLKIVVTTRVSLGLKSEHIYELGGLEYPKNDSDELLEFDAIKLFLSAAKRVAPSLLANEKNLKIIAKICESVEGMPLAIELSSAWLRIISLDQLYKQIHNSLDMFSSEHGDIALRHRNVRAVFDYSWQRLSDKQQDILKRLSIFQGGFSLQAAEQVADAHLGHLLNMTNESLIRADGNNRFSMHELIRKYVSEKLIEDKPLHALYRLEHARFFNQMLANCDIEKHDKSKESVKKIDLELENIRLAWQTSVERCNLDELVNSLTALDYYYDNRGLYKEARESYLEHIANLEKNCNHSNPSYAKLISSLKLKTALFASRQDQSEMATEMLIRALEIAAANKLELIEQKCYFELGVISYKKGDFKEAENYFLKAKEIGESLDDDRIIVDTVNALGLVAKATNNIEEARAYMATSIKLFRELKNKRGEAMAYSNLGNLEESLHNYEEAKRLYYLGLPIFEELNFVPGLAVIKTNIGVIEFRLNNMVKALEMSLEALELKVKMQGQRGIVKSYLNLARIYAATDEHQEAGNYLYRALELARKNELEPSLLEVVCYFVEIIVLNENQDLAMQMCQTIINHPKAEAVYKKRAREIIKTIQASEDLQKLDLEQAILEITKMGRKLKR